MAGTVDWRDAINTKLTLTITQKQLKLPRTSKPCATENGVSVEARLTFIAGSVKTPQTHALPLPC